MILKGRTKEEGQSTVEFALSILLLMGFVFFFFQLSMVMALGNYVHYATFMAARAYLSAGPNQGEQRGRATNVIVGMLKQSSTASGKDRFPMFMQGVGGDGPAGVAFDSSGTQSFAPQRNLSWLQGVRYTFRSQLFLLPFGGSGSSTTQNVNVQGNQDVNSLTLTSESFLGRDPTDGECQLQLQGVNGIYDNGC